MGNENVLTVHHVDLIQQLEHAISTTLDIFGVEAENCFLHTCANKVDKQVRHSRKLIECPISLHLMLMAEIQPYSFSKIHFQQRLTSLEL